MKYREFTEEDGTIGREYDHDYIMENPIPAKCSKCKKPFVDGPQSVVRMVKGKLVEKALYCRDAIRAPSLSNCRCFYCGGQLVALEKGGPDTVEAVEHLKSLTAQQPMLNLT